MKIVTKNSDGSIAMIADCPADQFPSDQYTVHDMPGWDWSLADLTGVDRTRPDWIQAQLMWNGSTLVRKP